MDLNKIIAMAFKSCCVFFLTVLIACQSSLSNSPAMIAPEARIYLNKGGPYAGSWQSKDILLEYQYYNASSSPGSAEAPGCQKLRYHP